MRFRVGYRPHRQDTLLGRYSPKTARTTCRGRRSWSIARNARPPRGQPRPFGGSWKSSSTHITMRRARAFSRKALTPTVPLPRVDNARIGYFDGPEVAALLAHIPDQNLRDVIEWGFITGMRKGEAAALTWNMLDRSGAVWVLRIPGTITKSRDARALPLAGTARAVMERRWRARLMSSPWIFHRESKGKAGAPIRAFDKMWRNALKAARLPEGRIFHD